MNASKKRVGMVIGRYPPIIGGTEIQCRRLSQALAARGHDVTVLTEKRPLSAPSRELQGSVMVRRFRTLGRPPFSSLLFCLQLLGHARRLLSFDILHSHLVGAYGVFLLAFGRLFHKPVLIKIAGGNRTGELYLSQQSLLGRLKLKLIRRWTRALVCPSRELVHEWRLAGFEDRVFHCIPNGIDIEEFSPPRPGDKSRLRRQLGLAPDRLIAIYAGRSNPGKGVDMLLKTWSRAERVPVFRWTLVILTPEDHWAARHKKEFTRLSASIKVIYDTADPRPYYWGADVAILLSEGEGLSNFLLESMASGLPTLTTPAAAVGDSPEWDQWGWVLPATSSLDQDVLACLSRLQEHTGELIERGARARRKIENSYSISQIARSYESLYDQMIQENRGIA